jgi:hypothetical protein
MTERSHRFGGEQCRLAGVFVGLRGRGDESNCQGVEFGEFVLILRSLVEQPTDDVELTPLLGHRGGDGGDELLSGRGRRARR